MEVELDTQHQMELDTVAAVSLMSEQTYQTMFPDIPLKETKTTLKMYSGEPLRVIGQRDVQVKIAGQTANLPLTVVAGNGATPRQLALLHLAEFCKSGRIIPSQLRLSRPGSSPGNGQWNS